MFGAEMDQGYDVAQICLNGHVVNSYTKTEPTRNSNFCSACGKATTTKCTSCNHEIRGHSLDYGYLYDAPSYCLECGAAYPWTSLKIQTLLELIRETDGISDDNKTKLIESTDDIIIDTPKTKLASNRFKLILNKITPEQRQSVKNVAFDLVCQTAKNLIWGS